jgi:hypothetical protein
MTPVIEYNGDILSQAGSIPKTSREINVPVPKGRLRETILKKIGFTFFETFCPSKELPGCFASLTALIA